MVKYKGWIVKIIFLFSITLFCFFLFKSNFNKKSKSDDIDYINELDLSMIGKVESTTRLSYNCALVHIEVTSANLDLIDDRSDKSRYYIILKNDKAELYIEDAIEILKNDSIVIDDKIYIFRDNKKIIEKEIALPPKTSFSENFLMKEIKKAHKI